jgi:predicted CXXCH cytochrome family protein
VEGDSPQERSPPIESPTGGKEDKTAKDYDATCLRSGCHARLAETQFVHAPVALGACASCHEQEGEAAKHRFKLAREQKDLCSFCHRPKTAAKYVHTAYRDGQCTGCHEAHGGRDAVYLKVQDRSAMCLGCHDARSTSAHAEAGAKSPFAFLHKPVAEGKCADCHLAHQSDHAALLPVPERELCLKCHEPVLARMRTAPHVHKPLETECTSCHAGHGGANPLLLRSTTRSLCLGCHVSVLDPAPGSGSLHAPVRGEGSCLDCHVGHASAAKSLVVSDLQATCYRCHAQEITLADGRRIPDVKAQLAAASSIHEPVAKGDCGACHAAHSSPHGDLLAKPFPRALYADFSQPAIELCFGCHDARLATAERTEGTAFRDGDRNLHHVHTRGKKGRTCALCHESHASAHPGLTRESFSLGPRGWIVPIGFRRTEKGGACAPGCHQEMTYRNRP